MILGLISDTHGLLRPKAVAALEGVDRIIHAGDIGAPEILALLRALAPLTAVKGNIDTQPWAMDLPETATLHAAGTRIHVIHDVKQLAGTGFDVVVSGHSHKPRREERNGVLYINPGSAGPRRFKLPVTVARLDLRSRQWKVDFIEV